MKENIFVCPSTHGGAGYAVGTYWVNDVLICGICKQPIPNPAPTNYLISYKPNLIWWKRLLGIRGDIVKTPYIKI